MIVLQSPANAKNASHRPCHSPSPGGDLSRLGSGERNLAEPKVAQQPSERARASQRRDEGELNLRERSERHFSCCSFVGKLNRSSGRQPALNRVGRAYSRAVLKTKPFPKPIQGCSNFSTPIQGSLMFFPRLSKHCSQRFPSLSKATQGIFRKKRLFISLPPLPPPCLARRALASGNGERDRPRSPHSASPPNAHSFFAAGHWQTLPAQKPADSSLFKAKTISSYRTHTHPYVPATDRFKPCHVPHRLCKVKKL
jgi:hypothetical protein